MSVMLSQASVRHSPEDRETKSGKNPSTADRGRLSFRTGPDLIPPPEVCAPKPFLATTLRWVDLVLRHTTQIKR